MSGPLCDAVTGQDGGKATLEALDRRNLFLIPLDDRRRWYRYHHLFADVLQARLLDEQPERVAGAAPAGDRVVRAGRRTRRGHPPRDGGQRLRASRRPRRARASRRRAGPARRSTLRRWLEALPDELIRTRPVLSDAYAGSHPGAGRDRGRRGAPAGRRALAGDAPVAASRRPPHRRWSSWTRRRSATCRPRSPSTAPAWPGSWATSPAPIAHARRALELVGEDDHLGRGGGRRAARPRLLDATGTSRRRPRWYAEAMANLERAGYLSDVIGLLDRAGRHPDRAGPPPRCDADLRAGPGSSRRGQGGAVLRGAADMHVGHRARSCASAMTSRRAARHLRAGQELGEDNGLPQNAVSLARRRWPRIRAGGRRSRRRARAPRRGRPPVRRRLLAGRPPGRGHEGAGAGSRRDGSRRHGPGRASVACRPATTSRYVREFEHITLARLLLAQGARDRSDDRIGEAIELLERLLAAAEAGGRTGSVIEILVVQALAQQARGDVPARRSARWVARSRSPSPRATCASSSTKVRRWRRC